MFGDRSKYARNSCVSTEKSIYTIAKANLIDNQKLEKIHESGGLEQQQHMLKRQPWRRRCVQCYKVLSLKFGRKEAQRKSSYTKNYCEQCNKAICESCFGSTHKYHM